MKTKLITCLVVFMLFFFACLHLSPAYVRQIPSKDNLSATSFSILHFDLHTEVEPIRIVCEIPVLENQHFGDEKINSFFMQILQCFASEDNRIRGDAQSALLYMDASPLRDCRTAEVTLCTDKLFSAAMQYDRYLGGVTDYGIDGYAFDRESGERLSLRDVVSGGEARVKEAIAAALLARYPDIPEMKDADGNTPLDAIRSKPFDSFDFYLTDAGTIVVVFDKYEIAPGAAGMFSVELDTSCTRDLADIKKPLPLYTSLKKC